jgi:hypothetical protein
LGSRQLRGLCERRLVIVIASARSGQLARDSAAVSAGSSPISPNPPAFGLFVKGASGHYEPGRTLLAAEFLAAGTIA